MTPVEIAYFKHFMLDKALIKTFCKYFRIYHIEENPKSIEEYFKNIPAEKVIVNAFFFKMEGKLNKYKETFDYWKKVHYDWKMYWSIMENNHSNEDWWKLTGTFDILRQNWDLTDFFLRDRKESAEETYKRLGLEPPYNFGDTTEEVVVDHVEEEDNDDPFAGIEFFDEPSMQTTVRIKKGEASLNFRSKSYKLTFNRSDSELIWSKGFKFARVGKVGNDICIILNNIDGAKLSVHSADDPKRNNALLNYKEGLMKLKTLLNIKNDYSIVHIEVIPYNKQLLIYKVTL